MTVVDRSFIIRRVALTSWKFYQRYERAYFTSFSAIFY